jgi:hypothetical protein
MERYCEMNIRHLIRCTCFKTIMSECTLKLFLDSDNLDR